MSRGFMFGIGGLAVVLAVVAWRVNDSSRSLEIPFATRNQPPEAAPLCPWREPERDLNEFFPQATRYEAQARILSGRRLELAKRLGRAPTGDENALRVFPVFNEQAAVGFVLTRRVKGEFGSIELVLAANTNREICGVRLQRLREPAAIAEVLQDSHWLHAFDGKSASSALRMGQDIPDVAEVARNSADAVVDGARSLLILLETSDAENSETVAAAHHR